MKIDRFSSVQKEVLTFLSKNCMSDLLIQTKPYSNENLVWLINALDRIDPKIQHPQVVIVSATSELVLKIAALANEIAECSDIKILSLVGGKNSVGYVTEHCIVATIGNLLFCLGRNNIFDIKKIKILVLNEVCTLVSSNKFASYVHELIRNINKLTQIQLFTTCFDPRYALDVFEGYVINLKKLIFIKTDNIFKNVNQFFLTYRNEEEKYESLVDAIKNREACEKILVFVIGKKFAFIINEKLRERGIKSNILVSDLPLDERIDAINEFKKKKKNILIANFPLNVGALQLIEDQSVLVINYDLPLMSKIFPIEYYFRAAEASFYENRGIVLNFIHNRSINFIINLENYFNIKMLELNPSELRYYSFLEKKMK